MTYITPRFGNRFGPRLLAYFFQSNCHWMVINYIVIKSASTSD